MQRTIIGFHQDEAQEWVADLECGHQQHVRHTPPWLRPSGSFRLKAVAVAQGAVTLLVAPWRHGGVDVVSRANPATTSWLFRAFGDAFCSGILR